METPGSYNFQKPCFNTVSRISVSNRFRRNKEYSRYGTEVCILSFVEILARMQELEEEMK